MNANTSARAFAVLLVMVAPGACTATQHQLTETGRIILGCIITVALGQPERTSPMASSAPSSV